MLLMSWFEDPYRADLDLSGFGDRSPETIVAAFKEILAIDAEDGVDFDLDGVRVDEIQQALEYGGLRQRTTASISCVRITVTAGVAFEDALEPDAAVIDYPCMLVLPAPRLRAHTRETVIAEKFQAMVALGRANARMRAVL